MKKESKFLVSDDESDEEKNKREPNNSLEVDNDNIDIVHYVDLSISDGNSLCL